MKLIQVKTSTLSGEALNWISAEIVGLNIGLPKKEGMLIHSTGELSVRPGVPARGVCFWNPLEDMDQLCGLQDQFFIDVQHCKSLGQESGWIAGADTIGTAIQDSAKVERFSQFGESRPLAILRALAAACHGATVYLPIELAEFGEPVTQKCLSGE